MLSVKQGAIKYHFLSLWHDTTGDWTPVSQTIGEHSTHLLNGKENKLIRLGPCLIVLAFEMKLDSTIFRCFLLYILTKILESLKSKLWLVFKLCLTVYIIKGFRTTVFIFIVISTTFRSICPPTFFRCLSTSWTYTELRTTSFIESTGVTCSDSVCHNRVQVFSIPVCYSPVSL